MEPSNLVIISSDEEDNKLKTCLDRKSQRFCISKVRNGAAIKNPQHHLQSPNSSILRRFSPYRRLIRSKSAEILGSQPDAYKSMKRAMSAPGLLWTPRASTRTTKSPVANEKRSNTRDHEAAGYRLIEQPLAHSSSNNSNETPAGTTKFSGGVSKEPRSTHAPVHVPLPEPLFRGSHTSSQPTTTTTGAMDSYHSTSCSTPRAPCLNPPPEPTYIPRPPCPNPTPRPSFADPFPQQRHLKYAYPAASKTAAPRKYVSPYSQQNPRARHPQHLIGRPMPVIQSLVPKRKADDSAENAPKRIKKEITGATPSQNSSPARSKFSESSKVIYVPSEPSAAPSSPRPPRNRAWTSVMLVDFAETLRNSFDFNAFATKHGKAVKDIRDTFEMVVSKPIFEHSSRGMARAKMQSFNQKLKEYVAWMKRGGRDVHGELTTSPWRLSDTAKGKNSGSGGKDAKAGPSNCKAPATPKRARALKTPGEPLIYKDGIYQ